MRRFSLNMRSGVMPGDGSEPLGAWNMDRIAADFVVVQEAYELEEFDAQSAYTNAYIDDSIAYPEQ